MAFVYKAKRLQLHSNQQIGPGSYYIQSNINKSKIKTPVFKKPLNNINQQGSTLPGPGHYNIISQFKKKNKILYENSNAGIIIQQQNPPSSFFKSTINRNLQGYKQKTPGPGQQQTKINSFKQENQQIPFKQQPHVSKINALQESIKLNKYKSIPSIPSLKHQKGYYFNKNKLQLFYFNYGYSGQLNDSVINFYQVGPGSYSIENVQPKELNQSSFFKSKVNRQCIRIKKQELGPGSYFMPQYFKGKKIQLIKPKKKKLIQMSIKSTNYNDDQQSDQQQQYIESTPGPGYYTINADKSFCIYQNNKTNIKSKKKKIFQTNHFNKQQKMINGLGPGQYNINKNNYINANDIKRANILNRNGIGFHSSNSRFLIKKDNMMSPIGLYNPRISIQNQAIKKLQNGYRGNFGVSVNRLQKNYNKNPGVGQYQVKDSFGNVTPKETSSFKSRVLRDFDCKGKNYLQEQCIVGPGFYNPKSYNIQNGIKQNRQLQDDDIPKIPFNNHQQRFKPLIKQPKGGINIQNRKTQSIQEYIRKSRFIKQKESKSAVQQQLTKICKT